MAGRLEGKVCVITGAASGIGAESARLFADEGARVVGVDLEPGAEGELAIEADVTDEAQVRGALRAGRRRARPHRRAVQQRRHQPDRRHLRRSRPPLEAWQRVQDVNLRGVFLCCKHGIPHLLDSGRRLGDQHRLVRRRDGRRRLADLLHGLQGRACWRSRASSGSSSPAAASASTRSARARSTRRCSRSCSPSDPAKAARRLVHLPMGRFAEAERDRQGRALPRQRRVLLRHRRRPSSSTAASPAPT